MACYVSSRPVLETEPPSAQPPQISSIVLVWSTEYVPTYFPQRMSVVHGLLCTDSTDTERGVPDVKMPKFSFSASGGREPVNSVHVTNEGRCIWEFRIPICTCKLMLHRMTTWEMAAMCSS